MKRRHHYVPKFYLDGFVDTHNKPYIWIYEKGNSTIRRASPSDLAVRKHYYSFDKPDGETDSETFEKAFSIVEAAAAKALKRIGNAEILDDDERVALSIFLALMLTRVPTFRENVEKTVSKFIKRSTMTWASHEKAFTAAMKRMEKETGEKLDIPVDEIRKFALEGEFDITINPVCSLGMTTIAFEIAPILFDMKWKFLRATNDFKFITSDNPVCYFVPTSDPTSFLPSGLLMKDVLVTFPLSPDLMFIGSWEGPSGYVKAKNQEIRDFTKRTVIAASRFIFSSRKSDGLNRMVQKYKDVVIISKTYELGDMIATQSGVGRRFEK